MSKNSMTIIVLMMFAGCSTRSSLIATHDKKMKQFKDFSASRLISEPFVFLKYNNKISKNSIIEVEKEYVYATIQSSSYKHCKKLKCVENIYLENHNKVIQLGYEIYAINLNEKTNKRLREVDARNNAMAASLKSISNSYQAKADAYSSMSRSTVNTPSSNITNYQSDSAMTNYNCGIKPVPPIGYSIGRCINGKWQFVSNSNQEIINCGVKPVPPVGYRIGSCVNGKWDYISTPNQKIINCGVKPIPPVGYKIGGCVNGRWQYVSN